MQECTNRIVLIDGPQGSGKTSYLHGVLEGAMIVKRKAEWINSLNLPTETIGAIDMAIDSGAEVIVVDNCPQETADAIVDHFDSEIHKHSEVIVYIALANAPAGEQA